RREGGAPPRAEEEEPPRAPLAPRHAEHEGEHERPEDGLQRRREAGEGRRVRRAGVVPGEPEWPGGPEANVSATSRSGGNRSPIHTFCAARRAICGNTVATIAPSTRWWPPSRSGRPPTRTSKRRTRASGSACRPSSASANAPVSAATN